MANGIFKLRISKDRKYSDKNSPKPFLKMKSCETENFL